MSANKTNRPTGPRLPLIEPYKDERGSIQSLVSMEEPAMGSAVWITSKKGSIRGNHYHKKDWHYCYVVSGSIEYHHRPVNSPQTPERLLIKAGEMFYTPPMIEHAMLFPEETVFLTLGGGARTPEAYEEDLVRVRLI